MPGPTKPTRIHITGASGTGVTTLGQELAARLDVSYVDSDDAFWLPTDPQFTTKRPIPERLAVLEQERGDGGWVIAGSLCGWGDRAIVGADLIVFLTVPTRVRISRLAARQRDWFGDRITPGGDMERINEEFMAWAKRYDDPDFTGRSRVLHEAWLIEQSAPVLRLDGTRTTASLVSDVTRALDAGAGEVE